MDATIPPMVCDYANNDKFILAIQKPLDSKECKCYLKLHYPDIDTSCCSKKWIEYEDKCQDYIFNKSTKFNYWIIQINNDSIYGPLSKREFLIKRKKLGVPENLEVNE